MSTQIIPCFCLLMGMPYIFFEQLAQLNAQIETKHIAIQTSNKMQHLELSYPSLVVCNPLPELFCYSLMIFVLTLNPLSLKV